MSLETNQNRASMLGAHASNDQNISSQLKIVVYDLCSENLKNISSRARDLIRAARIWCTEKLHSLGLMCTESVILVSPSRATHVDNVIERVKERYRLVNNRLREIGERIEVLEPVVKCISLTQSQESVFLEIARRRLIERIDESVERINKLYEELEGIVDVEKRKRIKYGLTQSVKEWNTIREYCSLLGLNIERDLAYLIELIDNLIAMIEGE